MKANIYIPVAIAFLAILFMVSFLFVGQGKVVEKKEIKEIVVEKKNNKIENKKEEKSNVFYSETENDEPQFMMESSEEPRNDASSHKMDERYFKYFRFNDYDYMNSNMQDRLTSLHNAEVKANKAKRVYKDVY